MNLSIYFFKNKGKIVYEEIVRQLGDIVGDDTIRKYLQSLKGFSMRKYRILPHLSITTKFRRAEWAGIFWLFWKSGKGVPTKKVRIVLIYMDEECSTLSAAELIVKLLDQSE